MQGPIDAHSSQPHHTCKTTHTTQVGPTLQAPFSAILDEVGVKDPFIRNYLNLLCFLLQGLPVDGTMTAVVAYMLGDWVGTDGPGGSNSDVKLLLDYPKGGTGAIVDALVRGFTRRGGRLHLGKHVEEILLEPPANPNNKPRAVGVRLKGGRTIRARKAVVSNASIWDTAKLLPKGTAPEWEAAAAAVPQLDSFLHLHVGIDAAGLEGLNCHYALVDDWDRGAFLWMFGSARRGLGWRVCRLGDSDQTKLTPLPPSIRPHPTTTTGISAPGNVVIVSLPSLLDPSLAPPGCITIHAYTAGNEPYSLYDGLDPKGPEYAKLKAERSEVLWRALEKIIPDVRRRVKVGLAGTPLTHQRFLRRSRGSYGPRIVAGTDAYPSSKPPVEGLQLAGDSVFPGVGIPAVAASGNIGQWLLCFGLPWLFGRLEHSPFCGVSLLCWFGCRGRVCTPFFLLVCLSSSHTTPPPPPKQTSAHTQPPTTSSACGSTSRCSRPSKCDLYVCVSLQGGVRVCVPLCNSSQWWGPPPTDPKRSKSKATKSKSNAPQWQQKFLFF